MQHTSIRLIVQSFKSTHSVKMAWAGTLSSVKTTTEKLPAVCDADTQRQCMDGSCISRMKLCPEEEMLNQDTILIMIGVGLGVVLFLILLYCLQQRRNTNAEQRDIPNTMEETDHPELLMPPPSYREAVDVCLYPPTLQTYRNRQMPSIEEPMTPPPNYDAALNILAQSHETVLVSKDGATPSSPTGTTPVLRRALSVEHVGISRGRPMTFSSFGANAKTFMHSPREEVQQ